MPQIRQPRDPMEALSKASSIGADPHPPAPPSPIDPMLQSIMDLIGIDPWNAAMDRNEPKQAIFRINPVDAKARSLQVLENAKKSFPESMHEALEFAQKRYPRVMGHVDFIQDGTANGGRASGVNRASMRKPLGRSSIILDSTRMMDPPATLGHELTHAAQRIWNPGVEGKKGFSQLYDEATQNVGYLNNPFEVGARQGGKNFADRLKGLDPRTLIQLPKSGPPPISAEEIEQLLRSKP